MNHAVFALASRTCVRNVLHRSFSSTIVNFKKNDAINVLKPIEYRFDVPWGHITGKWWKSELDTKPIVLLHGWQDNAGSFDRLVPLLPKHHSYLAIDFPGHGLSSQLPNGIYYSSAQLVQVIDLVRRHFGWEKISLCSHSMGAILSFFYASIVPDNCDLLIALDVLPLENSTDQHFKKLKKIAQHFNILDNRTGREPPTYTVEEMSDRWVKGSNKSVTKDVVHYLLERSICRSKSDPNKYCFTKDRRLKYVPDSNNITQETTLKLAAEIKAPHLLIKARQAPWFGDRDKFEQIVDTLTASNPNFEFVFVEGTHHVHLVNPIAISGKMTEFLCKHLPAP